MAEKISFIQGDSAFSSELKRRVDQYFTKTHSEPTGNIKLYSKTIILFTTISIIYYLLVFAQIPGWASILLCVGMGINISSIGFNVMHDGAHGSYSKKHWVNELMGLSLNVLGGNMYLWKFKHNILHHTFTNIEDHDEDIDIRPLMRTNTAQEKKWFHKYQHLYFLVLYAQMYFWWVYIKDFSKYFSGKVGNREFHKMDFKEHMIFWVSKVIHFSLFVFIPLYRLGFVDWFIGYSIAMLVTGVTISVIFQLAHVVPTATFPLPDEKTHKIEQNWMIHQLATTVNFAPKSKLISWFVGGLNFQVEHHLFPKISHIHYPQLRLLVKELCGERNVPYNEYPTFFGAIKAHISYLKQIGAA